MVNSGYNEYKNIAALSAPTFQTFNEASSPFCSSDPLLRCYEPRRKITLRLLAGIGTVSASVKP